ncbi:MAG: thiamine-phosphate kinase [Gemmatimonadota bacterium]
MTHLRLGPGAEFDRIRGIAARLGSVAHDLGDDCALLPDGPSFLALSTDLSIENVHFRRDWLTLEEIGWRAAAAALSDLAAVGASCIGVLAAIGAPKATPASEIESLMTGVGQAVSEAAGLVLGGDLSSASEWLVGITVVGRADRPVRRGGGRAGDGLWVTGALGGARAALQAWQAGRRPTEAARSAFAHPVPRIASGRALAAAGATAMLDLSDGLAGDVRHLAAASGCSIRIRLEDVPVATGIFEDGLTPTSPECFAAAGGEDYELLVALPDEFGIDAARHTETATGVALTRIGTLEDGEGVIMTLDGLPVPLEGYDHF